MVYGLGGSTAARALTYGYSNARVKAMQTLLLSGKDLEALTQAKDLNEVVGFLERTPYKDDLVATSLKYSGANRVELALGLNYARTAGKLMKIVPPVAQPVLAAILRKWDVHNLKTLLLAKYEKKPAAEIEPYLVRCGGLSGAKIRGLLQAETVEAAIEALQGTEYGVVLEKAQEKFRETKDMNALLEALDRYYYAELPGQIKGQYRDELLIKRLVEAEVDTKNLGNALRLRKEGKDDAAILSWFIEGGSLGRAQLQALLKAKGLEGLRAAVHRWMGLPAPTAADQSLAQLETRLARRVVEQGLHALRRSILSLGSLVGFLYLKENEVGNVRKIVRAKEYHLPEKTTMEMLVMPS